MGALTLCVSVEGGGVALGDGRQAVVGVVGQPQLQAHRVRARLVVGVPLARAGHHRAGDGAKEIYNT